LLPRAKNRQGVKHADIHEVGCQQKNARPQGAFRRARIALDQNRLLRTIAPRLVIPAFQQNRTFIRFADPGSENPPFEDGIETV